MVKMFLLKSTYSTEKLNSLCKNVILSTQTDLSRGWLRQFYGPWMDKELLSFLEQGISLKADVELQLVLTPHLASFGFGMSKVREEMLQLEGKGWCGFFSEMPFCPCRLMPRGCVPRAIEGWLRPRPISDGGSLGRGENVKDVPNGQPVISLNDASGTQHP